MCYRKNRDREVSIRKIKPDGGNKKMGTYFNPSNKRYAQAVNSRIYVDKTPMIEILNTRLFTEEKCISVSHARRFGKSQDHQQ